MEVAPGYLARAFTSPPPTHSRLPNSASSSIIPSNNHPLSQYSTFSEPSNRSSDSTQDTSASTLFAPGGSPASSPPYNGPIGPTNNVINRKADKETLLFQTCTKLRNRLSGVPGFEAQVTQVEALAEEGEHPLDPVTLLWRTFRKGYPLLLIYNALYPSSPIAANETSVKQVQREKSAAYSFLVASQKQFPVLEQLSVSDLFGEDTAGFVKVVKLVSVVVDQLIQRGVIVANDIEAEEVSQPQGKLTQRQYIVDELVKTERTYVQHLELLQEFKKLVEQKSVISGDAIYDIFLNLDTLLDFQRRFLIKVEQTKALPEEKQNWGQLFKFYADPFRVYEPYIANQKRCEETATREFDKLREAGGSTDCRQIVESSTVLASFLLKPFQRLSKYPLLLRELREKGDLDQQRRDDIAEAIEAITMVLERINALIDREERMEAVQALKSQVEDWRNHRVEAFGELLLHGNYTVIKGDGSNSEREYKMYLFEKILLCCKELGPRQMAKNKYKALQPTDKKGRPRMALKGRIFMQNVTESVYISRVGSYNLQIFWRGDDSIEYFSIRFPTEEQGKKWLTQIEVQRKLCQEQVRRAAGNATSDTEFNYIRDQGVLENPYRDDDVYVDGDAGHHGYVEHSDFASSRHASSTSLRSRSTTGESGISMSQPAGHAPAMRYPPGFSGAPLSIRTQHLSNGAPSPDPHNGNSYFSPTFESPLSSRTSSSSGMFPFPRQATPSNGWHVEDSNRYTAPACSRPLTNDAVKGAYQVDPRTGRVVPPSQYPPHPASLNQTRNRSASTPLLDINSRRPVGNPPPIPSVPSHLAAIVNRSQNNSPSPTYSHGNPSEISVAQPPNGTNLSLVQSNSQSPQMPTMLRVKVKVPTEGSTFVLVVAYNIHYTALRDRIDSKLQRQTNLSLADGTVKLKYLDEDTFVTIQTDEDVQMAFETWKERLTEPYIPGQQGEVELYCHK